MQLFNDQQKNVLHQNSRHDNIYTCWSVGPVDYLNLLAPNNFYKPPQVYHKGSKKPKASRTS